jgi:hypothetical protein
VRYLALLYSIQIVDKWGFVSITPMLPRSYQNAQKGL